MGYLNNRSVSVHRANFQQSLLVAGFTLVEVMVALFILATAATALVQANSSSLRYADTVAEKTLAMWVGNNALSTVMVSEAVGEGGGIAQFAGRAFYWHIDKSATSLKGFEKIEVRVTPDHDRKNQLVRLVAYRESH